MIVDGVSNSGCQKDIFQGHSSTPAHFEMLDEDDVSNHSTGSSGKMTPQHTPWNEPNERNDAPPGKAADLQE
jgi:hypothetical protein